MQSKRLKVTKVKYLGALAKVIAALEDYAGRNFTICGRPGELEVAIENWEHAEKAGVLKQLGQGGLESMDYTSIPAPLWESKILTELGRKGLGVILTDEAESIVYVSKKAEELLGKTVIELYSRRVTDFLQPGKAVNNCNHGTLSKVRPSAARDYPTSGLVITDLPMYSTPNRAYCRLYILEKMPGESLKVQVGQEQQLDLIGNSPNFRRIINSAQLVAKTDSTVLLRGESGTGKELMARYIHQLSNRGNRPFIAINCAAIPASLMESELFGYVEGAFTGAKKGGKIGLLEAAHQGTIFFDEVTEISPFMQVKILRFLQEGTVRRVGDVEEKELNVRVIAGTNRNVERMVGAGEFREDLYYRLNVFPIFIPPLRERKADLPNLAEHFISKLNKKLRTDVRSICQEALLKLQEHNWPGNIRELEYIIERAMILAKNSRIQADDLIIDKPARLLTSKYRKLYLEKGFALKQILQIAEKDLLEKALQENSSIRMTARSLGVTHTAILTKMQKLKISKLGDKA